MPSLKLNEIFQRRTTRDDKHDANYRASHGRKSSLTLSAFNFSLTIEKDDKNTAAPNRPSSTVETTQHGPVWWHYRRSVVDSSPTDENMDQLLKARKMGSAAARRRKALEREAATASMDDLVERTRRELKGGYKSEEEELSDSEENTYSPVIGGDENDSLISVSTDDTASIHQARFSTSIRAKAVPLISGRSNDRRPSGLRLTIDSDEGTISQPTVEEEAASANPSPSILDPSDVSESGDYFSIVKDDDLASPSIPAGTPLETATPILYVSPITRPNLISIHSRTSPQLQRITIPPRSASRPSLALKSDMLDVAETDPKSPQTAINMILQTVPPSSPLATFHPTSADNSVGIPSVVPHDPTDYAPTAPILDHSAALNSSSGFTSSALSRTASLRRLASKASLKRQKSKPELIHQHPQLESPDPAPALPGTFSDTTTASSSASATSLSRTTSVATTVSTNVSSVPYTFFPPSSQSNPHHQANTSTITLPSQQTRSLASKKSFASLRSLTYTISPTISDSANQRNHNATTTKPRGRFPVVPRVETSARLPSPTRNSSISATPRSAYATPLSGEEEKLEEEHHCLIGTSSYEGLGETSTREKRSAGGLGLRRVMGQVSRSRER